MGHLAVKICGVNEPRSLQTACRAGAAYIGFVFFPPSARHINMADAKALAALIPDNVILTALLVSPCDALVDEVINALPSLGMLQLHGDENPARVAQIKARVAAARDKNLPPLRIMKALGVSDAQDLQAIKDYAPLCDQILLDAKPARDEAVPGGHGRAFDWSLLGGLGNGLLGSSENGGCPWMLAGGLTADNLAQACRVTGARAVDVSSGVERVRGVKDEEKIKDFMRVASTIAPPPL